jgi:transcription elongation factor S-II
MPQRVIANPVDFREKIAVRLSTFFENKPAYGSNLEKGIYNWALKECGSRRIIKKWENPEFVHVYVDHLRSIYANLQSPRLINLVTSGECKSHSIAFMTHQEMCPDMWEEHIQAKIIRDKNKFEQNLEAMTDTFTCRKCRSKKCSFYQLQTRSADEPMTIFVTCLDCGIRWKTS